MARRGETTARIGQVLDRMERLTKEVARSLDSLRDTVDRDKLGRARDGLREVVAELESLISAEPGRG